MCGLYHTCRKIYYHPLDVPKKFVDTSIMPFTVVAVTTCSR